MSTYIKVVCDNDLSALIISGNPSINDLEKGKNKLVSEFNFLCNEDVINRNYDLFRAYYLIRCHITILDSACSLLLQDRTECITTLNKIGIKCKKPENNKELESLLKKLKQKIKYKVVKLSEAEKRLPKNDDTENNAPSRSYYMNLLASLSSCEAIKTHVGINMTLSEISGYINIYKDYLRQMQLKNIK